MADRHHPLSIVGLHHATGATVVRDAWIDAIAATLGDGEHFLKTTIACTRHPVRGFERKDFSQTRPKHAIVFSVELAGQDKAKLSGNTERINALKQLLGPDPLATLSELTQVLESENEQAKVQIHDLVDKMLLDPSLEDPMFDAIDAAREKAAKLLILGDGVRYLQKAASRGLL